jgi:serine protease Do/serine protease DegQ
MRRPNRPAGRSAANDRGRLGVTAEDLTPQLGDYFGASSGALVTSVTNGSAADSAGVKAGDVITKVNGDAVKDASDLADKVDAASGRTSLTVVREHHERTLTANLGSPDNTERSSGPRQITK